MLKKKPVNGMKDILPREMEIRDYVTSIIKDTYREFGFTPISTPCMEDIANLSGKDGGENEKLIFKVLKRGEKLNLENAKEEKDVVDFGMRYDLTVPLSRFYANNENELLSPFKALQIGNVWRADRPQRGRYRQFTQCDIDILGEESNLAEIELITATTTTLSRIGFSNFSIRINDRRILKAMAKYASFPEELYDDIFITLDKMDKIGLIGVKDLLIGLGIDEEKVSLYLDLFDKIDGKDFNSAIEMLENTIKDYIEDTVISSLKEIYQSVNNLKQADFDLVFDATLVRGMGYYTGTIFEIQMKDYSGSCGGGGRYDEMIGKFLGKKVPACGFSIGFERIIMLLLENDYKIPSNRNKIAILLEKNMPIDKKISALNEAMKLRKEGNSVLVENMNKNKKFQKERLNQKGYQKIIEYYIEEFNK